MTLTWWIVLTTVCLLYVGLGIWAIAQIFPRPDLPSLRPPYGPRRSKGPTP